MDSEIKTPKEILQDVFSQPMSDETCNRFFLPTGSTWLKALIMSQFEKAFQGDPAAFMALLQVGYPEGLDMTFNDDYEDDLSKSLRQLVESL